MLLILHRFCSKLHLCALPLQQSQVLYCSVDNMLSKVAIALAACALVNVCTADDVPPLVKYTSKDIGACNPADSVFNDPRGAAWKEWLTGAGLISGITRLFTVRGGTVLIPTKKAIEDFMEANGFETPREAVNATGGTATWAPLVSSYFLANSTQPPKDVATPTQFISPFGTAQMPIGVFGPTPAYKLYVYVDVTQDNDNYQMEAGYLRFYAPNNASSGGSARPTVDTLGSPANFSDWTLACDQYVVYYLDNMLLPFSDPDDLINYGKYAKDGIASTVDFTTGQLAMAPVSANSNDFSGNGRRLLDLTGFEPLVEPADEVIML